MGRAGAWVEEEQQHWQQCECEEKEDGQAGIGQMLASQESHISLIEEVWLWQCVAMLVIEQYRQEDVHRHAENLDI